MTFDHWNAPLAHIPVRGRITVPPRPGSATGAPEPEDAAVFLAAAAVTTGTVLVENWPAAENPSARKMREVFASAGLYVVSSADGLTVTSRSTGGELTGFDVDFDGHVGLAPVAAVLAALAETPSVLRGIGAEASVQLAEQLRGVGASAAVDGDSLHIAPGKLAGGDWPFRGDTGLALAGMVLGLKVAGVRVAGISSIHRRFPQFDALWLHLMHANEHLLPGSGKLPQDYVLPAEAAF